MPLCGVPIDVLHFTVGQLALNHQCLHEIILSSLWEGKKNNSQRIIKLLKLLFTHWSYRSNQSKRSSSSSRYQTTVICHDLFI